MRDCAAVPRCRCLMEQIASWNQEDAAVSFAGGAHEWIGKILFRSIELRYDSEIFLVRSGMAGVAQQMPHGAGEHGPSEKGPMPQMPACVWRPWGMLIAGAVLAAAIGTWLVWFSVSVQRKLNEDDIRAACQHVMPDTVDRCYDTVVIQRGGVRR